MSVELERTWTYIWKTKDEDIVSWTGKNLNLPTTGEKKYEDIVTWTKMNLNPPTKNKIWRYCQLNWKELEPTYEKQNMKIWSVKLERTWTYLRKTKYEDIVSWTIKNLNLPTTGEKKMKILWLELKRTWIYLQKTKYADNFSWTRKNLNLHMKNKVWRYCQLNWKELEPTYNRRKKIWSYCDLN